MIPCIPYPKSLVQKDDWRCGWFTTYNICTMKKYISQYRHLKQCDLQDKSDFKKFIQNIHKKDKHLYKKYKKKQWLNRTDVERIIMYHFNKSCFEGIRDINIVEETQFNMILPKENYVIENINRFQSNPHRYPQFFIFNNIFFNDVLEFI